MGIKPSGLGLRLSSLQLHLLPRFALCGLRCPFAEPFTTTTSPFLRTGFPACEGMPALGVTAVNPLILLFPINPPSRTGLRLRVRARFSGSRSEPELSLSLSSGICGVFCREDLVLDLVVGPK